MLEVNHALTTGEDSLAGGKPGCGATTQPLGAWWAIGFALVFPTLLTVVYFVWMSTAATQLQQVSFAIGKGVQFAFPLAWLMLFERQKVKFRWPNLREVGEGAILGGVIVAAMLVFYVWWLEPSGQFDPAKVAIRAKLSSLGIDSPPLFLAAALFYCLCHSFLEEYYFRWFLFGRLLPLAGMPMAVIVSALGFMAHHVVVLGTYCGYGSLLTWFLSFCVAVGGVLWAIQYRRTGALYGSWISHMLVDAGIFAIGYSLLVSGF